MPRLETENAQKAHYHINNAFAAIRLGQIQTCSNELDKARPYVDELLNGEQSDNETETAKIETE